LTATQTFTIEVAPPPALALADSVQRQVYALGEEVREVLFPEAQGGVPPYQYSLTPELPEGLTFDATNRRVSGAPKQYTYTATDSLQTRVQASFSLEVYTISFEAQVADQSYVVGHADCGAGASRSGRGPAASGLYADVDGSSVWA